jgi:hypothetical protein
MTKQELKTAMIAKGILNTSGSRDPLWIQAFEEYNKSHSPKLVVSSCGSCYNEVRKWLNS